jgi:CheY-like chemotaxis protein
MNAVIGFTHLLSQNARPDQEEFLKVLKFSANNLMSLINDVLDFNKIEEGKIIFEKVPFSMYDLMNNIRLSFRQKIAEKNLYFRLELDNELPSVVIGDQVRLAQVVSNLAGNAIKFTEEGGVIISLRIVKKMQKAITIAFEVKDSGIGIDTGDQEKIFEVFTQASSDTTRKYGGSGLGLAIVKKLLHLQQSQIKLSSEQGCGATFYFELDFETSAESSTTRQVDVGPGIASNLAGVKILLVEDNPINVLLAKEFLRQWSVECDVAVNGLDAVEAVKSDHYDLVLMDLQMPEMDGYQATRAIRNLTGDYYSTLPIIALTASVLLEDKEKVLESGMNDFVTKPFIPEELQAKIAGYCMITTKLSA